MPTGQLKSDLPEDTYLGNRKCMYKLDQGKPLLFQACVNYFPHALCEIAKVSAAGYTKYGEWGGWRKCPDGINRYNDALLRHIIASTQTSIDEETKMYHKAMVAWNALAVLELWLIERKTFNEE